MATVIKAGTSAKKINKILKQGGEIVFKKGNYDLDKTLVVYSNTIVTCEAGVIFNRMHSGRMLTTYIDKDTIKHNGVHNVIWSGGNFYAGKHTSSAIVIVICHAKDIVFDQVLIDGCVNLHSFEINSSYNVKIQKCTISNQAYKATEAHKEAIQIDYCYKGGLSIKGATADSACYDDTHCENISITDCTFDTVPNGIGTHVVSEKEEYHTNIEIDNCLFNNVKGNSIRLLGMKDVTITDCTPDGTRIVVDKASSAYTSHGKAKIPTRYNVNVTIDGIVIK